MADYIEREAVLNILASKNAPWDGYQKVLELPIADVQPVKHGQWIPDEYIYFNCSCCGCVEVRTSAYCPDCGARMDGEA